MRRNLGWKPSPRFRGIGILPMVIALAAGACGLGEEVSGGDEMRDERLPPTMIGDLTSEDFTRAYAEAASTGPEKFGFDADGRLETTSERVALLEALHRQAAQRGAENVTALSAVALEDPAANLNERIVALRNVALHSAEGRDGLGESLRGVLAEPQIADEAPFAYLQALDGVVYLDDVSFVPQLDRLANDPTAAGPARLALHRLTASNPVGVLRQLNFNPKLLKGLPGIRADLVAGADPSDPDAVVELERYLRRDDVGLAEKEKMIQRMDQPAFVIIDGIFTGGSALPSPADDRTEQVSRVQADWMQREEFRELRDAIRTAVDARR